MVLDDLTVRVVGAIVIGVLSAFLSFVSRHWIEAMIRGKYSTYLSVIRGSWKGTYSQVREGYENVEVEVELKVLFNLIYGTVTYLDPGSFEGEKLKCVGGILKDRFISLYYENETASKLQNGTIMLLLSGNNDRLTGHFLGLGPLSERIVWGAVELMPNPSINTDAAR